MCRLICPIVLISIVTTQNITLKHLSVRRQRRGSIFNSDKVHMRKDKGREGDAFWLSSKFASTVEQRRRLRTKKCLNAHCRFSCLNVRVLFYSATLQVSVNHFLPGLGRFWFLRGFIKNIYLVCDDVYYSDQTAIYWILWILQLLIPEPSATITNSHIIGTTFTI